MDANLLRNWLRTIKKESPPFVARNPPTADTEAGAERFLRNQAIRRGSQHLGSISTKSGLGLIAYGDRRVPLKRTSHLMPRDSIGNRSAKITEPKTVYKSPRDSRWGANYETDRRSKSGTTRPSSRTGLRSRPAAMGGRVLVVGGQLIPILGIAYVAHDLLESPDGESEIIDLKERNERAIGNIVPLGKSMYSSPLGKVVISVGLSKLGIF